MNLDSVMQLGRIEIEKKIAENLTLKLRTLTAQEYATVMKMAGPTQAGGSPDLSALGHLAELQITTLSYATVSMNGQTGTAEDFHKVYQNMQYPLMLEAYRAYLELLDGQSGALDELKKNLMPRPFATTT